MPSRLCRDLNFIGRQSRHVEDVAIAGLDLEDFLLGRENAAGVDDHFQPVVRILDLEDDRRLRQAEWEGPFPGQ